MEYVAGYGYGSLRADTDYSDIWVGYALPMTGDGDWRTVSRDRAQHAMRAIVAAFGHPPPGACVRTRSDIGGYFIEVVYDHTCPVATAYALAVEYDRWGSPGDIL